MRSSTWIAVAVLALGPAPRAAQAQWLAGEVALETRGFATGPAHAGQERHDGSLVLAPELYFGIGPGGLVVEPFLRWDSSDDERSHWDVRALAWEGAFGDWEVTLGIEKVFWGVTESQHLVDVVNQTDLVEDPDGEDKLGQPMVRLGRVTPVGLFEVYLLPGFRERTFPGVDGRLRPSLAVDVDRPVYESSKEERRVDLAGRWSHYLGAFDVGFSWLSGTNREPRLVPESDGAGGFALRPHYDVVTQFGIDAQWTRGAWLWKVEGITRDGGSLDRFWAMTAGVEYTLYQILGTDADLGLITEVILDDRGDDATTPFEDDVFVGGRLALNDTEGTVLLAGGIVDRESGTTFLNLEASRRLSNRWTLDVQARAIVGAVVGDLLYDLRSDDYVSIGVRRYF